MTQILIKAKDKIIDRQPKVNANLNAYQEQNNRYFSTFRNNKRNEKIKKTIKNDRIVDCTSQRQNKTLKSCHFKF